MTASPLDTRSISTSALPSISAPQLEYPYRVVLEETVFDHIVDRGNDNLDREVGGVLLGTLAKDDAGPFLQISASIDALHADEKTTELTFTHDTWDHINKVKDEDHPDSTIVGWWHTHPGFGIFLSDRDTFIHQSFFNSAFQIAYVYDPKAKSHGTFVWRHGAPKQSSYWIGSHHHVHEERGSAAKPTASLPSPDIARPSAGTNDAPIDPLRIATFAGIALVIGAIAGWFAHGFFAGSGPRPRQVSQDAATLAQRAIQDMDLRLVHLWRRHMDDKALAPTLAEAVRDIDAAVSALGGTIAINAPNKGELPTNEQPAAATTKNTDTKALAAPNVDEALKRLTRASVALVRLRSGYVNASRVLQTIERQVAILKRSVTEKQLGEHRTGIGQLFAELARDAATAKDIKRAIRLLTTAAKLDPGNYKRYQKQARTYDPKAKLPEPRPARETKPSPATPEKTPDKPSLLDPRIEPPGPLKPKAPKGPTQ